MCRYARHSGLRSRTPDTIPDSPDPSGPQDTLFHNAFQMFQQDTCIDQSLCHMVRQSSHMTESIQSQISLPHNLGHICRLFFQLDIWVDKLQSHDHRSLQADKSIYSHKQSQKTLIHTRLCRCGLCIQVCRCSLRDDGDTL